MISKRVTRFLETRFACSSPLGVLRRALVLIGLATIVIVGAAPARAAWTIETVDAEFPGSGHQSSIAIDAAQSPHLAYVNRVSPAGPLSIVRYAHKVAGSWVIENVELTSTSYGRGTCVALDSQGQPHVTYSTWTSTTGYLYRYAYKSGATWVLETIPASTDNPFFMALDSQDRPHVAYASGSRVRHAVRTAAGWTEEIISISPEFFANAAAIEINAQDQPVILFYTGQGNIVRLATRQPHGTWILEVIDGDVNLPTEPSLALALDSSGNPYVSYYDDGGRLAYRIGSSWTIVDGPTNGNGESGGLDAGDPGTAYRVYATTLGHPTLASTLRLATWSGGAYTTVAVDQGPGYIKASSLGLDASGILHAGYLFGTQGADVSEMRYAHSNPGSTGHLVRVPQDFPTIQSAIDAAAHEDTVEVSPGTYPENLDFRGKWIVVRSSAGPDVTIVDGGGSGTVVRFVSREENAALEGFTLRNGANAVDGGAIQIHDASPRIAGNVIRDNSAGVGGGISVEVGQPIIENNVILANHASSSGGGVALRGQVSQARLTGNRIEGNSADGGAGGIYLGWPTVGASGPGRPEIRRNVIRDNVAGGDGGGMLMEGFSSPLVADNLFHRNTAGSRGGAMYSFVDEFTRGPYVINNTFVDNQAVAGPGPTILLDAMNENFTYKAIIANNVMMGPGGSGLFYCQNVLQVIHHNDVFPSSGQAYGGSCPDLTGIDGNISADPRFADLDGGDFRLRADSPCVDAGDNGAGGVGGVGRVDLAGLVRVVDGNGDGTTIVDLGAHEFIDLPVATLVSFVGAWTKRGVELRWRIGSASTALEVEVQRAPAPQGPWVAVPGASRKEGDLVRFVDTDAEPGITHHYRLMARLGANLESLGWIAVEPGGPLDIGPLRVTPNPVHGVALIEFTLKRPSHVRLTILDLQGRAVRRLADRAYPAGRQELRWAASGGARAIPPGVLFLRCEVDGAVSVQRVIVVP